MTKDTWRSSAVGWYKYLSVLISVVKRRRRRRVETPEDCRLSRVPLAGPEEERRLPLSLPPSLSLSLLLTDWLVTKIRQFERGNRPVHTRHHHQQHNYRHRHCYYIYLLKYLLWSFLFNFFLFILKITFTFLSSSSVITPQISVLLGLNKY